MGLFSIFGDAKVKGLTKTVVQQLLIASSHNYHDQYSDYNKVVKELSEIIIDRVVDKHPALIKSRVHHFVIALAGMVSVLQTSQEENNPVFLPLLSSTVVLLEELLRGNLQREIIDKDEQVFIAEMDLPVRLILSKWESQNGPIGKFL
jgi:hypothetical protein